MEGINVSIRAHVPALGESRQDLISLGVKAGELVPYILPRYVNRKGLFHVAGVNAHRLGESAP